MSALFVNKVLELFYQFSIISLHFTFARTLRYVLIVINRIDLAALESFVQLRCLWFSLRSWWQRAPPEVLVSQIVRLIYYLAYFLLELLLIDNFRRVIEAALCALRPTGHQPRPIQNVLYQPLLCKLIILIYSIYLPSNLFVVLVSVGRAIYILVESVQVFIIELVELWIDHQWLLIGVSSLEIILDHRALFVDQERVLFQFVRCLKTFVPVFEPSNSFG